MLHEPTNSEKLVADHYGRRVRVRVCGLYATGDQFLLVKHRGVGASGTLWLPPGGGVEFGESAEAALRREFLEETGLTIEVGRLVCVHEFIGPPLHALELFFEVTRATGDLLTGTDPEMNPGEQLIQDVRFMPFGQLKALPAHQVHSLFRRCQSLPDVWQLTGYFRSNE